LRGVKVIFVISNLTYNKPSSRFHVRTALSHAEKESDQISERVKGAIEFRKLRGDYFGNAPFGYDTYRDTNYKRMLKMNEEEQKILDIIKRFKNLKSKTIAEYFIKSDIKIRGKDATTRFIKHIIERDVTQYNKYM